MSLFCGWPEVKYIYSKLLPLQRQLLRNKRLDKSWQSDGYSQDF